MGSKGISCQSLYRECVFFGVNWPKIPGVNWQSCVFVVFLTHKTPARISLENANVTKMNTSCEKNHYVLLEKCGGGGKLL